MPIEKIPCSVITIVYICDKCNKGRMRATGFSQLTDPPRIQHVCYACNELVFFEKEYPYQVFVENENQYKRN